MFAEGIKCSLKSNLRESALMGVALAAAVYRQRRVPDCSMKGRLADKPVDLGLGPRPGPADVGIEPTGSITRVEDHM